GSYPQKTAFNNWTTPTAPQLQGLVANPAGSSVGGWLSTAGGFNVLSGSRPTPLTSSSNAGEAWTMTNAAYVHCARDHPSCKTGGMQYVTGVNLKTGASSKMINDIAYNEQHLGVAVRTPSSCAFYYGAAPKDKASPCYLTVVRATWSNGTSSRDVTGLVQSMVSEGQLHIVASTNVLGAVVPSPATPTTTTTTPKTRFTIPTVPIGIAPGTVPSRTTTTTTPGKPAELTLVLWRGGTLEPITKVVAQGASFSYSS
ncbi:MAG TPA: hypothetical protein VMF35_00445, partial [Acidimicrobiales bacterium]|nr:hypothetical protein [Acidimicrobiales bacterium]